MLGAELALTAVMDKKMFENICFEAEWREKKIGMKKPVAAMICG